MHRTVKRFLIGTALFLGVSAAGAGLWWHQLDLAAQPLPDPATVPAALPFDVDVPPTRGRILAVVTSTARMGENINAGYELTELARAYYVFRANGFAVEVASPKGGRPPVNIDDELTETDYAFLNDREAQRLVGATAKLGEVDPGRYDAVYFVGGKGAMVDFGRNPDAQTLAAAIHDAGGVVGAVCHGPAALVGARLADGSPLLAGRKVAGFSNEEELFIIPKAREIFPFLLEDALRREAGEYSEVPKYLDHTVVDGRIVTGQNPWSTWSVAEGMIRALGHEPVARPVTNEEKAVAMLDVYNADGFEAARRFREGRSNIDRRLVLIHAMIALMDGRLGDAFQLQRLAHPE